MLRILGKKLFALECGKRFQNRFHKSLISCKLLNTKATSKNEDQGNGNYDTIDNLKYPTIFKVPQSSVDSNLATPSTSLHEENHIPIPGKAAKPIFNALSKHVPFKHLQGFLDILPRIIDDVIERDPNLHGLSADAGYRLRRIVQHNLTPFAQKGAMTALGAHQFYSACALEGLQNSSHNSPVLEPELNENQLAYVLGWVTELVISQLIIMDDVVDGSEVRFGQKSWHLTSNFPPSAKAHGARPGNVTASAFYDGHLLLQVAQGLLWHYFKGHKQCAALYKLLNSLMQSVTTSFVLEMDQNSTFLNSGRLCSMDMYYHMRRIQTGPFFSYFPIASAAILHGVTKPAILKQLKDACLDISLFYSVTRDLMDSYSNMNNMGNDGTDIKNGRITWLLITAMERASPSQKKQLLENVGKPSEANLKRVLEIYTDLQLPKLLQKWQVEFYENTVKNVRNSSPEIPRDYLVALLDTFRQHLSK